MMLAHRRHPGPAVLILIAAVSTTIAAILVMRAARAEQSAAGIPDQELAEVIVVPLDLGANGVGLALIDRRHHTICIYEYNTRRDAHERLALLAARSFRYDTRLEQFNTAEPLPSEVRDLLNHAEQFGQPPSDQPQPPAVPDIAPEDIPAPQPAQELEIVQ